MRQKKLTLVPFVPIRNRMNAAAISIDHRGVINFNQQAQRIIGLQIGDGISFSYDEERPKDWYIAKDAASEMRVRKTGAKESLSMNCKHLRLKLQELYERRDKKLFRIPLGEKVEGMEWFALITSAIQPKEDFNTYLKKA